MKSTLIVIHVMPSEIEMFERLMDKYFRAFKYLEKDDNVTIRATLNLNPELTDWEGSELKQDYFIDKFNKQFGSLKTDNQIITDTSCWGTTQQKREAIELDYDQFIFCDSDILFSEQLLKYQLNTSYQIDGMYVLSPSLPGWWDDSWDIIGDSNYLSSKMGPANTQQKIDEVETQKVNGIKVKEIPTFKFGCGMHTLYSKSFWNLVGIPESFNGIGPEDTFAMMASMVAKKYGVSIRQFFMDGIFVNEDYYNRIPSFSDKIKPINIKNTMYSNSQKMIKEELENFLKKLINI